jgi:hypothetical protein
LKAELERKALKYRDLARQIVDEQAYAEIMRLAAECEVASRDAANISTPPHTLPA